MLRVFLAGEGPSDIGDLAKEPQYQEGEEGFLQPLVRTLLATDSVEFVGKKLTSLPKDPGRLPAAALERQARQAMALAEADEADMVIFVRDVDREQGQRRTPTEAKRRVKELRDTINAGLSDGAIPGVAATPCRMIEAWALGDVNALRALGGDTALLPTGKGPEELWGDKHDPDSDHPKAVLRRVMEGAGVDSLFSALGEQASPETLEVTCPVSFAPFLAQLRATPLSPD